jgi:class 3 adenylate cyclase/tetratricopeptide (TPR) repeat protein
MRCPSCGFENPEGMKFCGRCASALSPRCPQCGFENPPGFAFCGQCATRLTEVPSAPPSPTLAARPQTPKPYTPKYLAEKILTSRSALEGERRQVTVLFADTAGFTTLAERLDPEVVHEIIDHCFEHMTAEVHRFEGTINQYTGDGVMALFGAPIAHEDSPRRAVHAALGIQRALQEYSQELQAQRGLTIQMRIGINTGLVVVGKIGDDLRMDYTAMGDTTNLAARLQQLARPRSVVISEATYRLVSGFFEILDLGQVPVKGHAPVHTFEVLRPRGRRTRFDVAVERGLTPLVGREHELGTLIERFHEVKVGHGQVVLIAGEAGIGKSRLVLEFRRALSQTGEDVTWLEGRCISFGQSTPFLPLIEQLRENFRIEEFDGEPEIIAKVEHGMRRMGELEPHIPSIRYLLSVDPGDPTMATLEASARRKQLFDALRALALRGARLRPLVLVVEDLHWVDTSTEEFLGFLMDSVVAVPLMLLLTYRLGYTPPFRNRSFHTTLTLHSLSEVESLVMAGRVLASERFPEELKATLMAKAEGVPLFIEEVTKTLLELGVLRREHDGYRIVQGVGQVRIPDTIQGIIMARLDRLGEDGKRIVQLASVIGRQFLVRLLERVAGANHRLEGLLRELTALEIIYEQGSLAEPAYIFKHALIQDVAYHSLLVQRRKALHQSVGDAIEELYQDRLEEHAEELVHHFSQGEVWEKAVAYGRQAGAKALARSANREAVAYFEQALRAVQQLPRNRDTIAQAIDLRFDLRIALLPLGEYARIRDALREAEAFAQTLDDQRRLGLISAFMMENYWRDGEPDRAIESGQRALALAEVSGDVASRVMTTYYLGRGYWGLGDYRRATDLLERTASEGDLVRERFGNPFPPSVGALAYLAWCLAERGEFAAGIARGAAAVRIAEAVDQPLSFIVASFGLGGVHLTRGDLQSAISVLERGLDLCRVWDIRFWFPLLASPLGYAYALCGQGAEALPLQEQAMEHLAAMGIMGGYALYAARLSESYWLTGRLEDASPMARRALALARAHKEQGHEAYALRLLGEIAVTRDAAAEAEVYYRQALALAEELGMRPLVAHCYLGLGTLYSKKGQMAQARAELTNAIELFRSMEMTFWLPRAEAELAKVE